MEHQLVRLTSLSFDGIDDYVQIDGLSTYFTVSLWFNYDFSWIKSKW